MYSPPVRNGFFKKLAGLAGETQDNSELFFIDRDAALPLPELSRFKKDLFIRQSSMLTVVTLPSWTPSGLNRGAEKIGLRDVMFNRREL